jgi:hypothetical protein
MLRLGDILALAPTTGWAARLTRFQLRWQLHVREGASMRIHSIIRLFGALLLGIACQTVAQTQNTANTMSKGDDGWNSYLAMRGKDGALREEKFVFKRAPL